MILQVNYWSSVIGLVPFIYHQVRYFSRRSESQREEKPEKNPEREVLASNDINLVATAGLVALSRLNGPSIENARTSF